MSRKFPKRRVVVTGYGMITPLGKNTEDTFRSAASGLSGIDYITSFNTKGLPCQIGGQVQDKWLDEIRDPVAQRYYKSRTMADSEWNMEAIPLSGDELAQLKFAMAVLMGTHVGLGGKPCYFLFTETTGWNRMLAVCGCHAPRVTVREVIVVS